MNPISGRRLAVGIITAVTLMGLAPSVRAQDFFSALFGGMGGNSKPPMVRLPFSGDGGPGLEGQREPRPRNYSGGRQAYCVRTCDGRYFPITATDNQSRAASCNNFCPASETKVVYGSSIDQAETESGKLYSELPNAFKYRTELVAGCTCNGNDQIGLAPISIESDPTLRKGDIVAGAEGLMVTGRGADKRGAALNMSPASPAVRAKYERPAIEED
jgi:hypothetical protein